MEHFALQVFQGIVRAVFQNNNIMFKTWNKSIETISKSFSDSWALAK